MVPEFDVDCYVEYDPAEIPRVTAEEIAGYCGPGYNRDYAPLFDVTWEDAEAALEVERATLDRAGEAEDASAFEAAMEEITNEAWEAEDDAFLACIGGIDLGAAGLVMAIVAAGGTTYTSCRGRSPGSHHCKVTPSSEWLSTPIGPRFSPSSSSPPDAACTQSREATSPVGAPTVEHCHRLGALIVEKKDHFRCHPPPAWREGLDDLLEERSCSVIIQSSIDPMSACASRSEGGGYP